MGGTTLKQWLLTGVCVWALLSPAVCGAFCAPPVEAAHPSCHAEATPESSPLDSPSPQPGGEAACCERPEFQSMALAKSPEDRAVLISLPTFASLTLLDDLGTAIPLRLAEQVPKLESSPYRTVTPPRVVYQSISA